MNTPPSNPESDPDRRWDKLIQQARADSGPTVNMPALLRVVRATEVEPSGGWTMEFSALFGSGRVVPACLAAAGAFASLAGWEVWDLWQSIPWAQLLATTGGVS